MWISGKDKHPRSSFFHGLVYIKIEQLGILYISNLVRFAFKLKTVDVRCLLVKQAQELSPETQPSATVDLQYHTTFHQVQSCEV